MSGTMPIRQRNAAWEALRKAAQKVVDDEQALAATKGRQERREAKRRLEKADGSERTKKCIVLGYYPLRDG